VLRLPPTERREVPNRIAVEALVRRQVAAVDEDLQLAVGAETPQQLRGVVGDAGLRRRQGSPDREAQAVRGRSGGRPGCRLVTAQGRIGELARAEPLHLLEASVPQLAPQAR